MVRKLKSITSVQQLFESHKALIQLDTSGFEKEKVELEKKIISYREEMYSLRKAKLDGEIDEKQYLYEKVQFEKEINRYEGRLSEIQSSLNKRNNIKELYDDIMDLLDDLLILNYDETNEFDELRFILMKMIEHVYVEKDGGVTVKTTFGLNLNDVPIDQSKKNTK